MSNLSKSSHFSSMYFGRSKKTRNSYDDIKDQLLLHSEHKHGAPPYQLHKTGSAHITRVKKKPWNAAISFIIRQYARNGRVFLKFKRIGGGGLLEFRENSHLVKMIRKALKLYILYRCYDNCLGYQDYVNHCYRPMSIDCYGFVNVPDLFVLKAFSTLFKLETNFRVSHYSC